MIAWSELDLANRLKCPIFDPQPVSERKGYVIGLRTLSWLLTRIQSGESVPLAVIREKYTAYWKATYYPEYEAINYSPPPDSPFWEGPRLARSVAKRLSNFVRKYRPVFVDYAYSLPLESDVRIKGLVTVVGKPNSTHITVLMPLEFVTRHAQYPEVTVMARWLWTTQTHGVDADIYFLPLLRGKPWSAPPMKTETVRALLTKMANRIQQPNGFPVPGSHCQRCVSKPCMRIYER